MTGVQGSSDDAAGVVDGDPDAPGFFLLGSALDSVIPGWRENGERLPPAVQVLLTGGEGLVAEDELMIAMMHGPSVDPAFGANVFEVGMDLAPGAPLFAEDGSVLDKIKKDYPDARLPTDDEQEIIEEGLRIWKQKHPPRRGGEEPPPIVLVFHDPPVDPDVPVDAESFEWGGGWIIVIWDEFIWRRRKRILASILSHELKHREDVSAGIDSGANILTRSDIPTSDVFRSFVRHAYIELRQVFELCVDICDYSDEDDKEFACAEYAKWAERAKSNLRWASTIASANGDYATADELDRAADSIPDECPCCK